MAVDRYVKVDTYHHRPRAVLDRRQGRGAAASSAQAQPAPTQVVIRGIQLPAASNEYLPVGVVGQPVRVDVPRPGQDRDRPAHQDRGRPPAQGRERRLQLPAPESRRVSFEAIRAFLGLGGSSTPEPTPLRELIETLDRLDPARARHLARFAYLLGRVAHADRM